MRFFYLRDESGFPVACVASELESGERVKFAVATHNPVDTYDRELAKKIAAGRLATAPISIPYRPKFVKKDLVDRLIYGDETPQRTKEAARLWKVRWLDRVKMMVPA